MKILVSACLLGERCRYDGKDAKNEKVIAYIKDAKKVIAVCPEVLGGLDTPREPSEIVCGRVITKSGCDVTDNFISGANEALKTAKEENIDIAILKAKSPSCGVRNIYDGSFSKKVTEGQGVFAKLLKENGFKVFDEDEM